MRVEILDRSFVAADDDAGFWDLINAKKWEQATFRAVASRMTPGTVVLDFGAWIGPVTLFAAASGASVYSFEPDPVAAGKLKSNIALNPSLTSRIQVIEKAVWPTKTSLTFGAKRSQGDSMSSVKHHDSSIKWQVETITPAQAAVLVSGNAPLFIKIDIEGAEYDAVPAMGPLLNRNNVAALVSFHPRFAAGGHPRWHKTIPLTKGIFDRFRGFKIYKVHNDTFRRSWLLEKLNNFDLAYIETRQSFLFVRDREKAL